MPSAKMSCPVFGPKPFKTDTDMPQAYYSQQLCPLQDRVLRKVEEGNDLITDEPEITLIQEILSRHGFDFSLKTIEKGKTVFWVEVK